jgi:hypothetical protein
MKGEVMFEVRSGDENSYAWVENNKTHTYEVLSKGEEALVDTLFAVIDEASIAPYFREPLKQTILQTLFLGG